MQPFPCDLQAQIEKGQRPTHTWTATRCHCRTQRRNRFRTGSTAAAPAAHTRYLSSPAAATGPEKTQGCVPRLSPKTTPMKIHAVTRMCLAANSHTTFRRSLLLCDVKSHTDLHCSLLSCAVESETTFYCSLSLSGVKSYTALHCSLFFSDVKYRTTLHCSLLFSHRHSSQSIVIWCKVSHPLHQV